MVRSLGFGSISLDFFALFTLGFPSASYLKYLTLPNKITRRTVLQKVRYRTIGFQVLFHSPPGVLFNFPSRYFFTIGHQVVFSLRGWSPYIHTRFLVSRTTLDPTSLTWISYTGLSPSLVYLPRYFYYPH